MSKAFFSIFLANKSVLNVNFYLKNYTHKFKGQIKTLPRSILVFEMRLCVQSKATNFHYALFICNHSATPLGNSRVNSFFSALVINTAYPPMGNSAADNFIFQPCSYYSKFHWGKNPHFKLLPCGASKKFLVVLEWCRVPTSSGKSLKKVPCMEKSWNLKKPE